jgi:hypothetical protein
MMTGEDLDWLAKYCTECNESKKETKAIHSPTKVTKLHTIVS